MKIQFPKGKTNPLQYSHSSPPPHSREVSLSTSYHFLLSLSASVRAAEAINCSGTTELYKRKCLNNFIANSLGHKGAHDMDNPVVANILEERTNSSGVSARVPAALNLDV